MTHSLHRQGSVESLRGDYVVIAYTSRVNRDVARAKLSDIAKIELEVGPCNTGSGKLKTNMALGLNREEFVKGIGRANSLNSCVSSKEKLREVLRRLKEADLGVSITVSGLIDEVIPLAQDLGLKPHTINLSLGVIGKTEKLPEEAEVLELTTMCGHALISAQLARKAIQDVATGKKIAREASVMMGRPCVCGIFNLDRGEKLLEEHGSSA